jgi:hypothetical protein
MQHFHTLKGDQPSALNLDPFSFGLLPWLPFFVLS